MTKLEEFKRFASLNPSLITYVKNGTTSWQKLYEMYDIYGEDSSVWNEYLNKNKEEKKETTESKLSLTNIMDMAKRLDTNKLEESITSVQKAIALFGDMLVKDDKKVTSSYTPRPIYRKFDD